MSRLTLYISGASVNTYSAVHAPCLAYWYMMLNEETEQA
jgi:lipid II:glycine glycyltransferase (peptidoglycan interpeptide bridge formation enzyme)